ncbi:helix-turn-helix domain-containing protein [Haladaptatus pallidirubidus]|uniref:helix-turn-helix domain-containing protein n=1 Tax=Haladaptatus pallidirubidus TaxID=1008152 RepID=UPI001D11462A|nr:helix-turn-helix domain-containing protein [Haladaptatus pallidirubidus]
MYTSTLIRLREPHSTDDSIARPTVETNHRRGIAPHAISVVGIIAAIIGYTVLVAFGTGGEPDSGSLQQFNTVIATQIFPVTTILLTAVVSVVVRRVDSDTAILHGFIAACLSDSSACRSRRWRQCGNHSTNGTSSTKSSPLQTDTMSPITHHSSARNSHGAIEHGYYDNPRTCSLTSLADELNVNKSVISGVFHCAEGEIIKDSLGDPRGAKMTEIQ